MPPMSTSCDRAGGSSQRARSGQSGPVPAPPLCAKPRQPLSGCVSRDWGPARHTPSSAQGRTRRQEEPDGSGRRASAVGPAGPACPPTTRAGEGLALGGTPARQVHGLRQRPAARGLPGGRAVRAGWLCLTVLCRRQQPTEAGLHSCSQPRNLRSRVLRSPRSRRDRPATIPDSPPPTLPSAEPHPAWSSLVGQVQGSDSGRDPAGATTMDRPFLWRSP